MDGQRLCYHFILLIAVLSSLVLASIDLNERTRVRRFKWTASIDLTTGIATSHEISRVPSSCSLHRTIASGGEAAKFIRDLFCGYPSWLATWPVSLGCLRSIPITAETRMKQTITALRDPVFGMTFLSFGPGRFSVREIQRRAGRRATEYTVTLPLAGGLLARPSSSGTFGSLFFTLISKRDANGESFFVIDTGIADGFRPALAGSTPPLSRTRAGIYRSSQSLLHAYIMWRFHRHCYHASESKLDEKKRMK